MQNRAMPKIMVRLPADVKEWLERQAEKHAGSQGSEIVRAIRERMDRVAVEEAELVNRAYYGRGAHADAP